MAKRTYNRVGDVYEVVLPDGRKRYFQYIAKDTTDLYSAVIRAFKDGFNPLEKAYSEQELHDSVDFYTHVFILLGIDMDVWRKVGHLDSTGRLDHIFFRNYGNKNPWEPMVDYRGKVCHSWWVWRISEPHVFVGKLPPKYHSAEPGDVFNPESVRKRLNGEEWLSKWYPRYE